MIPRRRNRPGRCEPDLWFESQKEIRVLPKIARYRQGKCVKSVHEKKLEAVGFTQFLTVVNGFVIMCIINFYLNVSTSLPVLILNKTTFRNQTCIVLLSIRRFCVWAPPEEAPLLVDGVAPEVDEAAATVVALAKPTDEEIAWCATFFFCGPALCLVIKVVARRSAFNVTVRRCASKSLSNTVIFMSRAVRNKRLYILSSNSKVPVYIKLTIGTTTSACSSFGIIMASSTTSQVCSSTLK
uniref:Uncharacterized protein n=1 Tax=Glossina palpalis gambiensis TaxID=67801 RepID=A0A1B0C3C7_9MUSC